MATLIIMRHAEAVSSTPGSDDFTRALTRAGHAAARRSAQRIGAAVGAPQLLLHSPALRTTATAHIVADALAGAPVRVVPVPAIYLAKGRSLQQLLEQPAYVADRVLLIGHNPGVSELLQLLSPPDARSKRWLTPAEFATVVR